jgi:hypothetical protein
VTAQPPTPDEWVVDGIRNGGHSVRDTCVYAAWCAAWSDQQQQFRAAPVDVISPEVEKPEAGWFARTFLGR